jgi:hypothetical protein
MGDVIGDLNSRRGMVGEFIDKPANMKLIKVGRLAGCSEHLDMGCGAAICMLGAYLGQANPACGYPSETALLRRPGKAPAGSHLRAGASLFLCQHEDRWTMSI